MSIKSVIFIPRALISELGGGLGRQLRRGVEGRRRLCHFSWGICNSSFAGIHACGSSMAFNSGNFYSFPPPHGDSTSVATPHYPHFIGNAPDFHRAE